MKTATALMLALTAPVFADVVVHDNRGAGSYDPLLSCFDGSSSYGRLDLTLTPAENAMLPCDNSVDEGVFTLDYLAPTTSCSGGDYSLFGRNDSEVFTNTETTQVINCPGDEGLATPADYLQTVDVALMDTIGPSAVPAGTQWRFSGVLQDVGFSVDQRLDTPTFVGVRMVRAGETRYGWLQFSEPDDYQNIHLLAWGYESNPGAGVSPIGIETITRGPDLNGDALVDSSDLAELLAKWGASGPVVIPHATGGAYADIDDDGFVGAGDLAVLLAAWSSP